MSFEGSSDVDTGTLPTIESDDTQDDSSEELEVRDESEGSEGSPEESQEDEVQLTEKGTKLDPNPLSAAHQQLANERRIREQYEQILNSPENLKRYAQQFGLTIAEAKAEVKEEQAKFTADRFKTPEDLSNAFNEVTKEFQTSLAQLKQENEQLRQGFSGFSQAQQMERAVNTLNQDLTSIESKYSVLNPKSADFNPELKKTIGEFYFKLDAVDPNDPNQGIRGQHSLAQITEQFMSVVGIAKQQGSKEAQTTTKIKQAGKVVTSSKGTDKAQNESKDPGTAIAQRIAKAMGN